MENYLVVGLGNIGEEYHQTRHNIGFMAVDQFANKHNLNFKNEKKFDCLIASSTQNGYKLHIIKPTTYMNLSGGAVKKVMNYYDIPLENILIIVDDLNLELGKIRIREKGSSGGHNGLNSINSTLGNSNYKRLRIGIGKTTIPWVDFVLQRFKKDELNLLFDTFIQTTEIIEQFFNKDNFQTIMSRYN